MGSCRKGSYTLVRSLGGIAQGNITVMQNMHCALLSMEAILNSAFLFVVRLFRNGMNIRGNRS